MGNFTPHTRQRSHMVRFLFIRDQILKRLWAILILLSAAPHESPVANFELFAIGEFDKTNYDSKPFFEKSNYIKLEGMRFSLEIQVVQLNVCVNKKFLRFHMYYCISSFL